jgi:type 1 glutamine amidotransferase
MTRAVIVSGGPTHDFPATSACLADLLAAHGLTAEIHTGIETAFRALPGAALLVVNALRWTMTAPGTPDRYRRQAAADGVSPSPQARAALTAHLAAGGGLLAMHTAVICFDDWPEWHQALGARWLWGQSNHPPLGPDIHVRVTPGHPLTDGIPAFALADEVYCDLDLHPGITPLPTATPPPPPPPPIPPVPGPGPPAVGGPPTIQEGGPWATGHLSAPPDRPAQPLFWAREHLAGRVVYDALGHHPPSYQVPAHRDILSRAIRWAADP